MDVCSHFMSDYALILTRKPALYITFTYLLTYILT